MEISNENLAEILGDANFSDEDMPIVKDSIEFHGMTHYINKDGSVVDRKFSKSFLLSDFISMSGIPLTMEFDNASNDIVYAVDAFLAKDMNLCENETLQVYGWEIVPVITLSVKEMPSDFEKYRDEHFWEMVEHKPVNYKHRTIIKRFGKEDCWTWRDVENYINDIFDNNDVVKFSTSMARSGDDYCSLYPSLYLFFVIKEVVVE